MSNHTNFCFLHDFSFSFFFCLSSLENASNSAKLDSSSIFPWLIVLLLSDVLFQWGEDNNNQALENVCTMGDIVKDDDEVFACIEEEDNSKVRILSVHKE